MDPIDRQAAIDAILRDFSYIRTHEFNAGVTKATNRIKQLPSAQSELFEHEIEQCCNNCKWYRSMDDYCINYSCNIDGREKHSCFEEE